MGDRESYEKHYAVADMVWPEFASQINGLLTKGDEADKDVICRLVFDRQMVNTLCDNKEYAYLNKATGIYIQERQAGIESTILDKVRCIDDILELLREVKFLIWRIEFGNNEPDEEKLKEVLAAYGLSRIFLQEMLRGYAFDKERILRRYGF